MTVTTERRGDKRRKRRKKRGEKEEGEAEKEEREEREGKQREEGEEESREGKEMRKLTEGRVMERVGTGHGGGVVGDGKEMGRVSGSTERWQRGER